MKKMIFVLAALLLMSSFIYAGTQLEVATDEKEGDVREGSQVSDSLTIYLKPTAAENQYVWVAFTKKEVTSSGTADQAKAYGDGEKLELAMSTTDTSATASNAENSLYISAQFAYNGRADVKLSGKALAGTGSSGQEYLGYTITKQGVASDSYLTVESGDQANVVSDENPTFPISHDGSSGANAWVKYYSIPLKITTDAVTNTTATEFTGEITATVESAD